MRRACATAVLLTVGSAGALCSPATAKRQTYCQKAASALKAKRFGASGNVILLRRGTTMTLCSDKRKKAATLASTGQTPSKFRAVENKCAVIVTTKRGELPEVLSVDLKTTFRKSSASAGATPIGFGNPAATVLSFALASNCVAATGAVVSLGAGAVDRRIDTVQILSGGRHTIFASAIPTDADLRKLALRPQGKGALVSWTENGAPVSRPLAG
jgi:hypothetical protein